MKMFFAAQFAAAVLAFALPALAADDLAGVHWNEGAKDCSARPQPPLEMHTFDSRTYVLRENLCATWEAPFMYLLIGNKEALLIDTGDVGDPARMPLAATVMRLLPMRGASRLPLLVVHTHRHLDHRAGDPQFARRPGVRVVGYDLDSVKRFYHFTRWPEGVAQIDLGGRTIDVIPTPGHEATHVAFYDRNTGLFFSGDFLMPGRLLIDDAAADLASARRVAGFVRNRPVRYVLGGHIEEDADGKLFPWASTWHPRERVLPMSKADLLALPAAVAAFNGFYTTSGKFTLMNPLRNLMAMAAAALAILAALVWGLARFIRRRRRSHAAAMR